MHQDHYITIAHPLRAPELKVVGSKFIADIFPVAAKEEADEYLTSLRKEFYDATHHCYAYRIGAHAEHIRAADDGEPAGTAGKPILVILESVKLVNVLCVVTRYFGGTKLGTGGLARAYSDAARSVVEAAEKKIIYHKALLRLTYGFDDISIIERMLTRYHAEKIDAAYSNQVEMTVSLRVSLADDFTKELIEMVNGRVDVQGL